MLHRTTAAGAGVLAVLLGMLFLPGTGRAADGDDNNAARLFGRVLDENNAALGGVRLVLRRSGAAPEEPARTTASDPTGQFSFETVAGDYLLTAELQGFFRLENRPVHLIPGENDLTVSLNPAREAFERVDVSYSPKAIDMDRTQPQEQVTNTQLLEVPYPSTNTLRNAMRILPGVVQDNVGGLHVSGGTEEQTLYLLDGFQINDPLSGRFESRMSMEAVRSMEVTPVNPAEFGKGSAGVLALRTSTGDDQFRYSGTNFIPGLEQRKGLYIGGWTPRFNFSGPIARGRAWFSESLDLQYDKTVVEELPKGQDRTTSWRASNLLRNQINLTPSNILFTGLLTTFWTAPHTGLTVLDPLPTTIDRRARQYFFHAKDQMYFQHGGLLEFGYAANRTFGREIPQGHGIYTYTVDGRQGYYFEDAERKAGRNQFLANLFVPSFTLAGGHQPKVGVDIDTVDYWQDAQRTGYRFLRADATVSRETVFEGDGRVRLSNTEFAWYGQDSWKPRPGILVEAGIRFDRDRLVDRTSFSPRLGAAWSPWEDGNTKFSAAWGVVHEQSNMRLFSRPYDQYSYTTHYGLTGLPDYGPALTIFTIGHGPLRSPRYDQWNLGVDRRFPHDVTISANYLRRRGRDGFTYVNSVPDGGISEQIRIKYQASTFDAIYRLTNLRRDVYDAVQVTAHQTFRKQYEWMASYTRSRALSNAVVDITADDPLLVTSNAGPMPWDAPNRFISWGYLPTKWENWAVAYLLDARNGFPFSVYDSSGRLTGPLNAMRFPAFFELNLHMERKFAFKGNRWAFRFGFNNITNHDNPNVVNADNSAPNFLHMYGGRGRSLNFRLRWLGKTGPKQ